MDISLSTTGFNDAARCLKRYEYRWVDKLVPKPRDVRPALRRGVWIHRCLQLVDEGAIWQTELQRMLEWAVEHEVPEDEAIALAKEVYELVQDYVAYWQGHEDSPGPWTTESTETQVEWAPRDGVLLTSTIDSLKRDRTGRLWIWERKTTQDIPDSDWRTVDPQTMLQYIEARAQGLDVAGIVFDYIVTRPAPTLRVTQGGALYKGDENRSTRARQWAVTETELRKKRASEEYISEMRSRVVSDAQWFQRYVTFRPDDNARQTLHDVAAVLRQINIAREKNHFPRSINLLDCRLFCPYAKLCMHEYQTGRKSDVYREEYMTPNTDDLFAMGRTDYQ